MVIAKSPVAGHSKTRLCPPCTPEQAAELAEAALIDTLNSVASTPCAGRRLVLDGEAGEWLPANFEVVPQVEGGLGERLEAAFRGCPGPSLLIGMDTPQVEPGVLSRSLEVLGREDLDAVVGLCPDGGYWAIGFTRHVPGAFKGVPMSSGNTGRSQIARLAELGLRVGTLETLRDVDYFEDAEAVAGLKPDGRFASVFAGMDLSVPDPGEQ
jgi:rSAM/selenodomain-associated transferase 1